MIVRRTANARPRMSSGRMRIRRVCAQIVSGALAAMAWGTLLAGAPFTAQYARQDWPREYWQAPLFRRINALLKFDRRSGLSRIKAPTLVTASDDDFITPRYFSEALARAIPGAKLLIRRGGGHSSTKTRAEEFNRDLLEFLAAP